MKLSVKLEGQPADLEKLDKAFSDDDDPRVTRDGGDFVLVTEQFDEDTPRINDEMKAVARRVIAAATLHRSIDGEIKTSGGPYGRNDDGTEGCFLEATITIRGWTSGDGVVRDKDGNVVDRTYQLGPETSLAMEDDAVGKVFDLLAIVTDRGPTWPVLYNVYEVIKKDLRGKDQVAQVLDISPDEIGRFTHTANNVGPAAKLGESRHATLDCPPPNPMSLVSARSFVETMVNKWMRLRLSERVKGSKDDVRS